MSKLVLRAIAVFLALMGGTYLIAITTGPNVVRFVPELFFLYLAVDILMTIKNTRSSRDEHKGQSIDSHIS